MELHLGNINADTIHLSVRCRSNKILIYLHVALHPLMQGNATTMVASGGFKLILVVTLLPASVRKTTVWWVHPRKVHSGEVELGLGRPLKSKLPLSLAVVSILAEWSNALVLREEWSPREYRTEPNGRMVPAGHYWVQQANMIAWSGRVIGRKYLQVSEKCTSHSSILFVFD